MPIAAQAAHRQALADDRAGPEEADAGHDLGRDARRVGPDDVPAGDEEVVEAVRGDEREQARAERHEKVRPHPRFTVAKLTLEADRGAQRRGDREPQDDVPLGERRDLSQREHR
jgi:hypothetical protein